MLQQGDLAGIERLLAKHSRTLRRSLWLDALVQPPLVFAIFWGTFADLIAADLRWAFAGCSLPWEPSRLPSESA